MASPKDGVSRSTALPTPTQYSFVVSLAKESMVFDRLLNDFERDFMNGFVKFIARRGRRIGVTGRQWATLRDVAGKLDVAVPRGVPAGERGDRDGEGEVTP